MESSEASWSRSCGASDRAPHLLLERGGSVPEWDGVAGLDEAEAAIEVERRVGPERDIEVHLSYTGRACPVERRVDHEAPDATPTVRRIDPDLIELGGLPVVGCGARPRQPDRARVVLDDEREIQRRAGPLLDAPHPL